jgi:hypothetical protein
VQHVLWIGGPPASGKTTVATRLARRHGLRLYRADTRTWQHRDRAIAAGNAAARRWEALSPADRWERSTPAEMLEMSLHDARGPMVIEDLRAMPESPLIVAEGSPLPASAVPAGVARPAQAVWLLPTREFQAGNLAAAGKTSGHATLYRELREVIAREARRHGVPVIEVDGSMSIPATVAAVDAMFAAAVQAGPIARTLAERRALLREMNDAIVDQVRGYFGRPWAAGDPDSVRRTFVCECGDPTCDAEVELTVGDAAAHRAYAPKHVPRAGTRMME